jgi:hypothetical protein
MFMVKQLLLQQTPYRHRRSPRPQGTRAEVEQSQTERNISTLNVAARLFIVDCTVDPFTTVTTYPTQSLQMSANELVEQTCRDDQPFPSCPRPAVVIWRPGPSTLVSTQ